MRMIHFKNGLMEMRRAETVLDWIIVAGLALIFALYATP